MRTADKVSEGPSLECPIGSQSRRSAVEKTLGPGKAFFAQCDATSEADVAQVIKSAKAKWPKARTAGLVYCSGISLGGLTVSNDGQPADLDIFKKVINVNLVGSYNAARLVAATIAQETGRSTEDNGLILLVSSASYQDPQPGLAAYAASKGGVASMVLSLSQVPPHVFKDTRLTASHVLSSGQDLARYGIRANAIAPSLFNTGMGASIPPGARQAIEKRFVHPKRSP